jgi:predicted MFS family arabinose efflux permease
MSRPAKGGASYRAVLTLPRARGLFTAGAFARLPYGLLPLPLLLALRDAIGSYTAAGAAFGAFGLVSAVLGPYRTRLAERRPAALPWLAGGFAALLGVLALTAAHGRLGEPAAIALAVSAGALAPPVGPLLRARWSTLARDEAQRQAALSLDTVAESTVFATGPVLGGALLALTAPAVALALCAGTVVLGFAALTVVLARGGRPATPAAAPAAPTRRARVPLRSGAFLALLTAVLAVGWAVAVAELGIVAAWGAGTAGPLLALFSVGGVLGGLGYGRRGWRRSARTRLAALGAAVALCQALPALLFAPAGAAVGLLLAGAATDAVMITGYLLVDELVPQDARAEGSAWINTCFNLGVAAGSSGAGLLLGNGVPPRVVLLAGAVPALLAALWAALPRARRRTAPAVPSAPAEAAAPVPLEVAVSR